jgi:uncharacterized membrane protein YvlD (DUF360 family)
MKILITALAFVYLLPMIPGIDFHGNFMAAIGLAVMFGVMLWAIEMIAMALSAVWTVGTLGLALLWIIPLWIIGFWILPAAALMLVAVIMPTHLTVSGWMPAILAGLVMLVIGVLTSKTLWGKRSPAQPA